MMDELNSTQDRQFMPVDVFQGGNGDLVIRQEFTSATGERYGLIIMPMADAKDFVRRIAEVALAALGHERREGRG